MSATERLAKLPDWPARMSAPVVAAYMGIGHTTFLTRFGSIGVKEGANVFWARIQLDRCIAEQFGLDMPAVGAPAVDEYERWKVARRRDDSWDDVC